MISNIRSRAFVKSVSTLSAQSLPRSPAASITSISSLDRGASTSTTHASIFQSGGIRSLAVPSLARGFLLPSRRDPLTQTPCSHPVYKTTRTNFSYAGPRKLSDILKTELLNGKSSEEISALWRTYHEGKGRVHGLTLDAAKGKTVLSRAAQCPFFLHPVFREKGHFMIVSQFQAPNYFLLASLEAYQMDPARAQPLLTISIFDDYAEGNGVNLIRCDIINPGIEDDEGHAICKRLLEDYGNEDDFSTVHLFNKKPEEFDVDEFVKEKEQKWGLAEKGILGME